MERARVVLTTWETDRGVHQLAVRGARGGAERLVVRYAGYREQADELTRRHVANAGVALILAFGDPLRVGYGDGRWLDLGAFVVGNHTRPALTAMAGRQQGVQVDLTPEGAYALFGGSVEDLTDRVIPVEEALGRRGAELVARLAEASSWVARFATLDDAIGASGAGVVLDSDVRWVWQQLRTRRGNARVDALVDEAGWSRRHVTRRFTQQIGLRPKTVARLARFERSLELLPAAVGASSLATVATDAGYYDQAHFNRDFREFAGCTPTQYLHESAGSGDVQFVQDDEDMPVVASLP